MKMLPVPGIQKRKGGALHGSTVITRRAIYLVPRVPERDLCSIIYTQVYCICMCVCIVVFRRRLPPDARDGSSVAGSLGAVGLAKSEREE